MCAVATSRSKGRGLLVEISRWEARTEILPATLRDLREIQRLERVCFPRDAWPILDLIGALTLPRVLRLKAMAEGRLVGFVAVDVRQAENQAWVATLAVLPEHRRQGLGTALLEAGEARLGVDQVCLCVRASNRAAQRLYERMGYRQVDRWPAYYTDREDAIVMEKWLEGAARWQVRTGSDRK